MTPFKAIHTFCSRECMPSAPYAPGMPRSGHLRCNTPDCPLWRHRTGCHRHGNRGKPFPKTSNTPTQQEIPQTLSPKARARAKILKTEQEAKKTGKRLFTPPDHRPYGWPYGELDYRVKETPLRAIRRHCTNCMGDPRDLEACSSLKCPLHVYRFGRKRKGTPPQE